MDDQDDIDQAAWHQQELDEQRRREQELLARAPQQHRELRQNEAAIRESFRRLNAAVKQLLEQP